MALGPGAAHLIAKDVMPVCDLHLSCTSRKRLLGADHLWLPEHTTQEIKHHARLPRTSTAQRRAGGRHTRGVQSRNDGRGSQQGKH
eukprot:scaffold26473_cov36-Tisochrysis_lutea.AAC.1